jgi:hypothetical protein
MMISFEPGCEQSVSVRSELKSFTQAVSGIQEYRLRFKTGPWDVPRMCLLSATRTFF